MTVSSQTSRIDYAGDGVTAIFPVPFYFLENTHLKVILSDDATGAETVLVLNTDYTVTGAGVLAGGSITVPNEPAVGFTLTILRSVPVTQETDYVPNDPFPAESHERALDKLTMIIQQLSTDIRGAIRVAESDPEPSRLPNAVSRALLLLGFDSAGNPIAVAPVSGSASDLAVNLANDTDPAKGAGQVGFGSTLSYALNTVGYEIASLRRQVITPEQFGAIADGTSHPLSERYATLADAQAVYPHATALTDEIDWAAFQSALNTTNRGITLNGEYILNRGNTRSIDTVLSGSGSLDYSTSSTGLVISGAAVQIQELGANIVVGDKAITFASAPTLSAFDVFAVYNPTAFSWSPHRDYYHAGEFFRVHTVSGSVANIYGGARDPYTIAAVDVYRIDSVSVTVDGIRLVPPAAAALPAIKVTFGVGVELHGVRGSGGVYALVEIDRCYDVSITSGAMVNNSPNTGDEYGLIVSNSQKVTIQGGGHQASRHAIALGGGAGVVSVPCRDILISDMVLETNSLDVGAADMHGNCDNVVYSNCIINTHANMAGRDATYRGCKIYGRKNTDGAAIFGAEVVGGKYKVIDCELIIRGDINSFGAIHLFPSELLKEALTLIVRNLTITGTGGGALGKIIRMGPVLGEPKAINTDVRGVRNELASSLCILFLRNENDTGALVVSNGHIVDDVYGPSGMALIQPTGAALTGIPTREMTQRGFVDVTTTVTTAEIAPAQTFRYPYSKLPTVQVAISSPTGATLSTVGGQQAAPIMYTLSTTQPRPAIIAAANFTAGTAVRLHWAAGISEI